MVRHWKGEWQELGCNSARFRRGAAEVAMQACELMSQWSGALLPELQGVGLALALWQELRTWKAQRIRFFLVFWQLSG